MKAELTDEEKWEQEWQRHKLEVKQLYIEGFSVDEIAVKTGGATKTIQGIIDEQKSL